MKKNNVNEAPVAETVAAPKPTLRRTLIMLVAILVALSLLTATFAVFVFVDFSDKGTTKPNGGTSGTSFDYFTAVLADYIALSKDQITNLTIPGFGYEIDEVTKETVTDTINKILLGGVALSEAELADPSKYASAVKWSQAIDYADEVFLYILRVEDANGNRVGEKFFENAYMDSGRMQIGMGSFGDEFDNKLIGLVPKDTGYFEKRTKGDVFADSTILISYTASETVKSTEEGKEDTVKNHENFSALRMELAACEDTAWRDALLAAYGTVGQYFSFEYEVDIDEDGDKETVKYEGVIDAVIEKETSYPLTATLPDDFFGANPTDEKLAALNGATLTFYINIDYIVPHEANTFETMEHPDIAVIQSYLNNNGFLPFTASNDVVTVVGDVKKDGELTALYKKVESYKSTIKKLKGEIETINMSGEIPALTAEIADLEAKLEDLLGTTTERTPEIIVLENKIAARKKTLESKEKALATAVKDLAETEANLAEAEPRLKAGVDQAKAECRDFVMEQLQKSYDDSVRLTKGKLVYEYLLENLVFTKLPESEITAWEERAKQEVEYYYETLSALERRNYRDIDAFAAVYFSTITFRPFASLPVIYFDYDEKDYDGYEDGIKSYLAPYVVKYQLLIPGIYHTFINDQAKLDAKIEAYGEEILEYQEAVGQPITRDQLFASWVEQYGENYQDVLRQTYAMALVVFDFLAENNTVDFSLKAN